MWNVPLQAHISMRVYITYTQNGVFLFLFFFNLRERGNGNKQSAGILRPQNQHNGNIYSNKIKMVQLSRVG